MSLAARASTSAAPVHSRAFRHRRFLKWLPLGLSYAFLYMGRYNLNVAKSALGRLMTPEDFGIIFAIGTVVYGVSFVVNGPLTDAFGGRRSMLASAFGAAVANLAMGFYVHTVVAAGQADHTDVRLWFSVLYAVNMYFQSFGAVAIVKVNSAWFHVRERGSFSGIFGTMISSGIFMAFTVNQWVLSGAHAAFPSATEVSLASAVFFVPALLLLGMGVFEAFVLRDRPSEAGQADFDTGDGSAQEEGAALSTGQVLKRILTHPILLTVAFIELCTGVVRQGVMQWFPFYAEGVLALPKSHFLVSGWGLILFIAGVAGGNIAGQVSDWLFQSRRAPAAGGLYLVLSVCALLMVPTLAKPGPVVGESKVSELLPGDRIVQVGPSGPFKDWAQVTEAFAAIPARCVGGARWSVTDATCTSKQSVAPSSLPESTGRIALKVERGGQVVSVDIMDPKPQMRAGERRRLEVVPRASLSPVWLGIVVFLMSLCVIGTHGLLSGTATMDFGGRRGTATAVGMIDGFVYLGTALQSLSLGYLTARDWAYWPWFMFPFTLLGLVLCRRIWNARPASAA